MGQTFVGRPHARIKISRIKIAGEAGMSGGQKKQTGEKRTETLHGREQVGKGVLAGFFFSKGLKDGTGKVSPEYYKNW
jgi:hypothetical protein